MSAKSILRVVLGIPLLLILPALSAVYLLLLSPLILLSLFWETQEICGESDSSAPSRTYEKDIIFNRVHDISKIYGCDTRNVQYRWHIFSSVLSNMSPFKGKTALDFGAGSLRDTWELSNMGFRVIAIDVNEKQLVRSKKLYDWTAVVTMPKLSSQPLDTLGADQCFDVIIAFDVLEHLSQIDNIVESLHAHLKPSGYMFVTVPNGRSLREKVNMLMLFPRKVLGILDSKPGVYHINFKTPSQWCHYFQTKGFNIHSHDMALGPFVNNWHLIHTFPFGILGLAGRFPYLEKLLCPRLLMRQFDLIDQKLEPIMRRSKGWNLMVLTRRLSSGQQESNS